MNPATGKAYRDGQLSIVRQLKKRACGASSSVRPVASMPTRLAIATPTEPRCTTKRWRRCGHRAKVAQQQGVVFANVLDPMIDVMTKAKAKYGREYHLAGGDGVHPDPNGHLVMAYAFLKALGCDGNIGAINVDLGQGKATASAGHRCCRAKAARSRSKARVSVLFLRRSRENQLHTRSDRVPPVQRTAESLDAGGHRRQFGSIQSDVG